jgi:prepilin-type N-terminal cleavage/methylation domain-containing protein
MTGPVHNIRNGFTLLEMLVALFVGSILLGIVGNMVGGLSIGMRQGAARAAQAADIQNIIMLRSILRDARFSDDSGKPLFRSQKSLKFLRRKHDENGPDRWRISTLAISSGSTGKKLTLSDGTSQNAVLVADRLRTANFILPIEQQPDTANDNSANGSQTNRTIFLELTSQAGEGMQISIDTLRIANSCCQKLGEGD